MMLRTSAYCEQATADSGMFCIRPYANVSSRFNVGLKARRSIRCERVSMKKHLPLSDGQQASPSATLPVLFIEKSGNWKEPKCRACVSSLSTIIRKLQIWASLKSFWHLHLWARCLHAAVTSQSNPSAARQLALVPPQSQAAVSCKGPQSVRGRMFSRVNPSLFAVNKPVFGLRSKTTFNTETAQAQCLRGFFRFQHLFHYQKGPAHVQ